METFGSGTGRRRGEKHGSHAPPSVRPPSKGCSLRLATSPASLPLVWPPRLHHSTCAVLLFLNVVPRSPHSSLFYCKFVCPHLVWHFLLWQVRAGRKTSRVARRRCRWFCSPDGLLYYHGFQVMSGTREGATVVLRVVVGSTKRGNQFIDSRSIKYLLKNVWN